MKNIPLFVLLVSVFLLFVTCSKDDSPEPAPEPVIKYALTTNVEPSEGGSISPSSGTHNKGTTLQLTATPSAHYIFKNWTGSASGTNSTTSVVMNSDKTVTALFEKKQYKLIVEVEGQGQINEELQAKPQGSYSSGSKVKITATPEKGWKFVQWSGDIQSSENPIEITIDEEKTVKAIFRIDQNTNNLSLPITTFILNEQDYKDYFVRIDPTNYNIVFKEEIKEKYFPEVGHIVVGTKDGGFLRKIKEIKENGDGTITFETDFATITEAFKDLNESGKFTLELDKDHPDFWQAEGVELLQGKGENINDFSLRLSLDAVIIDGDKDHSTKNDQIRISGSYSVTNDLELDINIDDFDIENIAIKFISKDDINLNSYIGLMPHAVFGKEQVIKLATYSFQPIAVGPVIIRPVIDLEAGVDLGAGLEFEYGYNYTNTSTILLSTTDGENWTTDKTKEITNGFTDPIITGAAEVKIFIKPKLNFKVYEVLSPYAYGEVYAKGSAELPSPYNYVNFDLSAGYGLGAGVYMGIWKFDFLDFYFEAYKTEDLIKEWQIPLYNLPEVQTNNPEEIAHSSVNIIGEVIDDGGIDLTEKGFYWGTQPSPENTGEKIIVDTDELVFTSKLNELKANTTYYIKTYATNIMGTSFGEEVNFTTKKDIGDLSITMQNAEGTSTGFPGSNGEVRIYNGEELIASETTDENGVANFTGIKSGDYEARFYHVVESSIHGKEYWGKKLVNITSGELQEFEFVRYMPYIESVKVYRDGEEVTGSVVYYGDELKIKAIVKNNVGAVQGKVRLLLDNDKTGSSIYDELSANYSLNSNGNTTEITIDYVPNEEGDIYFNINSQVNISELETT